uniref:Ribonuclease H n=1 Tax=Tanacetum cinerariifolium TaxID=118510 RepID=A0A699GLM4_TANCI|nr:ribonuclease H [Tanacetum cinerariifolium]
MSRKDKKNDKSFTKNLSKEFRKEREQYFEIQDLKAQLQDKGIVISELKKLIEKLKGKSMETKFEKSSVIRQPNAFKSQRPSVLGKPTTFSNSFERRDFSKSTSVTQNNVSNDFLKPVTAQTFPPNKKSILKNMNVLALGMYKLHTDHNQARTSQLPQDSRKTNKCVSFSTEEVEDQRRNVKLPKNKTSVTACNDSLNAKTLNVNSVCATCDTCVLNDKHDMCVLNSVVKPIKRTVASESNQKPRNFSKKLYERVSKTCSWWYPKFTPSGYNWKPKSHNENVNPNTSMPLGNPSRTANILEHMTFRCSTMSNTPLSSNSFAARRDCPIHRQLWVLKSKNDIVVGLPKLKFVKDHLCSSCELGKAKQKDGENLDKMKEKGDECIFGGNSTQSRAYRVFNKRTRVIMESIHVNFDELPHKASDHISSDPAPKCQRMSLDHDSLSPAIQFVSKSFDVSSADAPNQRQQHTTPLNNHSTPAPTCQVPTLAPTVSSSENIIALLTDYGFHFDKIPMYYDSKAAIAISCNPVTHSRTKHIDVRYHFIKDKVEKGIIELFFVGTEYQLADLFTKALPEERFKYLVRRLGMRCLTPAELEALANESA